MRKVVAYYVTEHIGDIAEGIYDIVSESEYTVDIRCEKNDYQTIVSRELLDHRTDIFLPIEKDVEEVAKTIKIKLNFDNLDALRYMLNDIQVAGDLKQSSKH